MAKKSFVLYQDQGEIFEALTDAQAGQLIKGIFSFNKGDEPKFDRVVSMAFISIKQALLRDLDKWQHIVKRNTENITKRYQKLPDATISTSGSFGLPNAVDSVNVNDNDSDKENVTPKPNFSSLEGNESENKTQAGAGRSLPFSFKKLTEISNEAKGNNGY